MKSQIVNRFASVSVICKRISEGQYQGLETVLLPIPERGISVFRRCGITLRAWRERERGSLRPSSGTMCDTGREETADEGTSEEGRHQRKKRMALLKLKNGQQYRIEIADGFRKNKTFCNKYSSKT